MSKIPGIYVEISGDSTQLRKDMAQARQIVTESAKGMSNALNNAIDSRSISKGTNTLIASLGNLSRASQTNSKAFSQIGVDLGNLQKVTGVAGTQFQQLQTKMMQTSAARAQVDSLKSISRAAGLSTTEIKALGKQFGLSRAQIAEVTKGTDKAGQSFMSFGTAAKTALAFLSAGALVSWGKQILAVADQYTLLESRLRLVTTGAENLAFVEGQLYEISLRTHQAQSNTVELYTRMARATENLGMSQADTLQITESINQALIVSGASATESSAALIQLSQGLASGVLRGEEFNSVMEQTPRLAQAIADGLGVDIGKLREMAKEGKLTAEVVTKALLSQKDIIETEFGQMATTVSQAMTDLQTVFYSLIDDANDASGATDGIVSSVQDLTRTIDQNRDGILSLFTAMIDLAGQVVGAFANIGQSIQGARAVASGELSFLEYATSDAAELKQALADIVPGMKEVDAELDKLADKRREVAESWAFTPAARKAKEEELKAIDESIDALEVEKNTLESTKKKYVDTWQTAKKEVESTTPVVKKHFGTVKVESDKSKKEHIKAEKDKTKATKKEVENRNTYYERYGIAERAQIESIKDSWQIMEEGKVEALARANDEIVDSTEDTTNVFVDEWSNAMSSIQSSIADMIYEFDFSMDSILDIFKRMLAEMLAAIIMSGIKDALIGMFGGSGGFLGGLFGSGTGGTGGGLGSLFGGGASGPATSGWGQIGGGLALAGGAYGMYSGARNIGRGNTGTGLMQAGIGAVSAYQGGVTLGLIQSGTATSIAQGIGARLGIQIGSTAGQTLASTAAQRAGMYGAQQALLGGGAGAAGTAGGASSSLAAAEHAYLAGQSGTAASTTGAGASTGAMGGMGIAAGWLAVGSLIIAGLNSWLGKHRPTLNTMLNATGTTEGQLASSGLTRELQVVTDEIKDLVPALKYTALAAYDASTGILTMQRGLQDFGNIADSNNKVTVGFNYSLDKSTGKWKTMITRLDEQQQALSDAAAAADGYTKKLYTVGNQTYYAAAGAEQMTGDLSSATSAMGAVSGDVSGLTSATRSLGSASSMADGQVLGFSQMIVGLGGVVGETAKSIGVAANSIASASGVNGVDLGSFAGGDQLHAVGGIFPGITRWGSHIIGEKRTEALIPLPYGEKTLDRLFDEVKKNRGGGQAIHNHIYLDGREIAIYVKQIDADLQSRGFTRLAA